jgi:hypothetical protein
VNSAYSWSDILGRFHAESFFTGSRADSGVFLAEGDKLGQWEAAKGKRNVLYADTIKPYGMRCYMLSPDAGDPDALVLHYGGSPESVSARDSVWRYHLIGYGGVHDTIIPLPGMKSYAGDSVVVPSWKRYDKVVFIASNGNGFAARAHYFSFFRAEEVPEKSQEVVVYPNPLPANATLYVSAKNLSQKYAAVSLRTLSGQCVAHTRITGDERRLSDSQWRWSDSPSRTVLEWSCAHRDKNPAAGTYILLVRGSGNTAVRKVFIQQ